MLTAGCSYREPGNNCARTYRGPWSELPGRVHHGRGPRSLVGLELAAGRRPPGMVRGSRSGRQAARSTGGSPKNGRVRWLRGHSPYFAQPAGRETLFVPRKQAPLFKNAISLGNFSQFKYNLFHENNVLQVW